MSGCDMTILAPDATAIVQDQNGLELAREEIASGASKIIPVNVGDSPLYVYAYDELNTGIDTSYGQGDDKDIRDTVFTPEINSWLATGRELIKPILDPNDPTKLIRGATPSGMNWFGNLERFTDTLGGQDYANGLKIDHYTGLMHDSSTPAQIDWESGLDYANTRDYEGYDDYFLLNTNAIDLSCQKGVESLFLGQVISTGIRFMSSTTYQRTPTDYYWMRVGEQLIFSRGKDQSANVAIARKAFTYDPLIDDTKLILT